MALKISGLDSVTAELRRLEEKTNRNARRAMYREAQRIRDNARSNAPVDEEDLEKSIVAKTVEDSGASHGRKSVVIGIFNEGGDTLPEPYHTSNDSPNQSKDMENYGLIMENDLTPVGPLNLGEKSEEKLRAGHAVGGAFMERAFQDAKRGFEERIQKEFERS